MANVFISYAQQDEHIADRLSEMLKADGQSVFKDSGSLVAGSEVSTEIVKELDNAQVVVVLLSRNSVRSKWVQEELRVGLERGQQIIPVLLDQDAMNNWVWPLISDRNAIRVETPAELEKVAQIVKHFVEQQTESVVFQKRHPELLTEVTRRLQEETRRLREESQAEGLRVEGFNDEIRRPVYRAAGRWLSMWPLLAAAALLLLLLGPLGLWIRQQNPTTPGPGGQVQMTPPGSTTSPPRGSGQQRAEPPPGTTAASPETGTGEPPMVTLSPPLNSQIPEMPLTPQEARTAVTLHSTEPRILQSGVVEIGLEVELSPAIPDAAKRASWVLMSPPQGASLRENGLSAVLTLPVRRAPYELRFRLNDWEQPRQFEISLGVQSRINAQGQVR